MLHNDYLTLVNEKAMEIILECGEAIKIIKNTTNLVECQNFESGSILKELDNAEKHLIIAHKIQTEVIQDSIAKDIHESTILFSHAQDTLMTTKSELSILKFIIKIVSTMGDKE